MALSTDQWALMHLPTKVVLPTILEKVNMVMTMTLMGYGEFGTRSFFITIPKR
jgi:hypothetical protein